MIQLTRVDHRLIHGQTAFSWTNFLGVDLILIPSDTIIHDALRQNVLRMAKPNNVKLIIKSIAESADAINKGLTDKYKMMILLESVDEAYQLISKVPTIKALNLGGMKDDAEKQQISKAVHLSETDIHKIKELVQQGLEITVQLVPDDSKEDILALI